MISGIILTFNSRKFIKSCLDSIFNQNYKIEVIVVDNGSEDGTVDFIKENYPEVTLIENKENLGTCRARNQGIQICKGEWILALDCDVFLERDFFHKILKRIKDLPNDIGMIQPKILMPDKKRIYSCGIYLSRILRRFYDIGKERFDSERFNSFRYIFGACSACALYKRKMLEEIKEETGYFDERFFFLVEDVDLSWRAKKRGWKTIYYPDLVCYHFGNSSNISKRLRQYLCFRNRYIMINKNENLLGKVKLFLLSFWYEIIRFIYIRISNVYLWRLGLRI